MLERFRRPDGIRPLASRHVEDARAILMREPLVHTLPGTRFEQLVRRSTCDAEFSGLWDNGVLRAVAWHGVSVSIIGAPNEAALRQLAAAVRSRRKYASVVGDARTVRALWPLLEPAVGPAREQRLSQPLLRAAEHPSAPDSLPVRPARPAEAGLVYPAAVAMFREEVGTDPERSDGGRAYRARVEELIRERRTYIVRRENDIVFKADVGALFGGVAQIHGVWTDPRYRGQGIASRAMRHVVQYARRDHAPTVTLYVNSFNAPARRAYAAAGFEQVGELATILL